MEHTERQQRKLKVSEEDLPLIELGHHLTMKIDEELRQHYGVKGPSLAAIRRILSQWQDDLKAEQARKSELLRKQKAALAPPPSVPQPSITLDVSPSKSPYDAKAETPKHTEPPNNKKQPIYLYALIATGLMIGTFGRIAYTENKIMTLSEQVELSSISNLSVLTSRIAKENEEIREELKNSLLTRSEELVNNLIVDPDNINKLKVIENILKSLNDLYPDSASTQKITEEFKTKKSSLEVQYRDINKDFQTARTYFANAKLKNPDEHFYVIAYQYSNSLFPLQGRIEFAERNSNVAELEKAQRMLNIFQYKINELKISHNKNINNQP
nr:hypothetical protein [Enterovibrio nigricans]